MDRLALAAGLLVSLALAAEPAATPTVPDDSAAILGTIKGFLRWALQNDEVIKALQPRIKRVPGSTHLVLDRSRLDAFASRFLASGLFDASFADAVRRYYTRHAAQLAAMTKAEFDELAKYGRGPLMEVENMDLLFCAQEYEYRPEYVDAFQLTRLDVHGDRATAEVLSPYQWPTRFALVRRGGRWLIAAYCVFE